MQQRDPPGRRHQHHNRLCQRPFQPWFWDHRPFFARNDRSSCLSHRSTSRMLERVSFPFSPLVAIHSTLLHSTSANSLCVTELLNDVQSATTTLSINNILGLITQTISGANIAIPQNVTCSNCSKAAYTVVSQNFPSLLSNGSSVQSECGSSFTSA